ncbi:hypothetical protein PCASD_00635 [Puccinia coronata f. sp. avenae]|uniref:Uncharacterized protein n=1 Tax=Puccinia coronata f. sp. avenae TaxID=200324 RepID=A0A2N5VL38_9BASI|nr:hypothetical protein PCASD_00635 [Puccinia coronata f. sp. avenae]
MFLNGLRENDDVVKINNADVVDEITKGFFQPSLVSCRCIRKPHWHHHPLHQSPRCLDGSYRNVFLTHTCLEESVGLIQNGENLAVGYCTDQQELLRFGPSLIERTAGVSISSPPSSLKFVKLSSKKRKHNVLIGSSSSEMGQILAQLLSNQNQPTSPSRSDAVASSEDKSDPPAISEYVKFVNIDEDKQASVMNILDHNKVNDYRMFKSKSITITKMKHWGLKGGTIAHLLDNVAKYKAYLAKKIGVSDSHSRVVLNFMHRVLYDHKN